MKNIKQNTRNLAFVMTHKCVDDTEVCFDKKIIQASYDEWADMNHKSFMNWGLWDKKVYNEFLKLNYDFSALGVEQDNYSLLLLYYLLRPLINTQFFNRRLLEIGCGNGIGLKVGSELLKTQYALGVDLTNKQVVHANANFYKENLVNYIQSDAECLPLENESFDIITNIESSHIYPRIENFFAEIDRILTPGGYFCYTDADIPDKSQLQSFELFLKKNRHLNIVHKYDITKMVQAAIYQRIIVNEEEFYKLAINLFGNESNELTEDVLHLACTVGLIFLPWWQIRFKKPELRSIAKKARKIKFWRKKKYFYYLIQKTNKK